VTAIARQTEHSVETDAPIAFAWSFTTDVRNWDDPPAQFVLNGPFAPGSEGTTHVPGRDPVRWRIRDVQPGALYVLETLLLGAQLSFEWRFVAVSDRRTRLTQRIVLLGENAEALVPAIASGFGASLHDGMARIAARVTRAAGGRAG